MNLSKGNFSSYNRDDMQEACTILNGNAGYLLWTIFAGNADSFDVDLSPAWILKILIEMEWMTSASLVIWLIMNMIAMELNFILKQWCGRNELIWYQKVELVKRVNLVMNLKKSMQNY